MTEVNVVRQDKMKLEISRAASRLFLAHGVAETSGDAIAKAAGVSTRTVWRSFRNKESCIEPVLAVTIQRFARIMNDWPRDKSLEAHLRDAMPLGDETGESIADGALAVQLVALCAREPSVRSVWLEAYYVLEMQLLAVVARRANRSTLDFDVRVCAATIVAAIRVLDEAISIAVFSGERRYTPTDAVGLMAETIRSSASLPICDPIADSVYKLSAVRDGRAASD